MEYWGINRSHTSLRLNALEKILLVPQDDDISRFKRAVPNLMNSKPLSQKEAEIILAFSLGVRQGKFDNYDFEIARLFREIPSLYTEESESHIASVVENQALRYENGFSRKVCRNLSSYFATKGDITLINDALEEFEIKWKDHESLSDAEFTTLFGSLLGYLEGVVDANTSKNINEDLFSRLQGLSAPEFLSQAQDHLSRIPDAFGLSIPDLLKDIAEITVLYVSVSGELLDSAINFSHSQLEQLESTHQYYASSSNESDLLQGSIDAHLRTLVYGYTTGKVKYDVVFTHISRAFANFELQWRPLVITLGKLTATLIGNSYQRLVSVFNLYAEYLCHLEPSKAFQSAHQFATICKEQFTDESSRIKLLYSLMNKLTAEEYSLNVSTYGEQNALQCAASLLSATVSFVAEFGFSDFGGLAITVLDQKLGTINESVDGQIIESWALLVPYLTSSKFEEVLEALVHVERRKSATINKAVRNSRITIAKKCHDTARYLDHLLELMILNGDSSNTSMIRDLFAPLSVLAANAVPIDNWKTMNLFRNAWFNLASLGFTTDSFKGDELRHLKIIANWAPPLVSEDSADHVESDLQLNPVLCRGTSNEILKIQQNALSKVISHNSKRGNHSTIRTLSMAATLLLEDLRAKSGSVAKLPHYFADTDISSGEGHNQMYQLTRYLTKDFVSHLGYNTDGSLVSVSQVLKELLVLACHRVTSVRQIATEMVTQIVSGIPAALCQHRALYALLDCLSLLDESILNVMEDEYSPKAVFKASFSGVKLELSDSLELRRRCLTTFEESARHWIAKVSTPLASDLRSKLYTYLGHSKTGGRGRKFALDILASDNKNDDFFSQYLLLSRYDAQLSSYPIEEVITRFQGASSVDDLNLAYTAAAPHMRGESPKAVLLIRESVRAPFRIFNEDAILAGITFWLHTIRHRQSIRPIIVHEVIEQSILTASMQKGVFTRNFDGETPMWTEMVYAPSNKKSLDHKEKLNKQRLAPHSRLLNDFLRSCMHNSILLSPIYLPMFTRLTFIWLKGITEYGSLQTLARPLRLEIIEFSIELLRFLWPLQNSTLFARKIAENLETLIIKAGLSWYNQPGVPWTYGSNIIRETKTLKLLKQTASYLATFPTREADLLRYLILEEYNKLLSWYDPLAGSASSSLHGVTLEHLRTAWEVDPPLAVRLTLTRPIDARTRKVLEELVESHPLALHSCEEALQILLDTQFKSPSTRNVTHQVLYWVQSSPIQSINLLSPSYGRNKTVIQYALRSLQLHPVTKCFFYVPQIVQLLRHDESGMVEEYILETAKFSQKFAHQIIWNILANMYMDDDGTIPDPMKPQLDSVLTKLKEEFSDEDREYYETEFKFFAEVTNISGKLKPYIKKSKAEKKEKIDEELAKIEVPPNVYLPSHPDGSVIDIDRSGGKPLQSHAKAPFLAKFKIRLDVDEIDEENVMEVQHKTRDVWQGAIFKVGDDCRQDVLALQVISVFRSIFNFSGLDVYVFPYKVTATAAGRGVIDVLPNSTSRDMLGREAVNGLDQWYRSKHGGPDSISFQRARLNFVKSMAAYSVISYLIQFKDRHNGNIMYDDDGHVIHIDFGFCFDIAPGGVRFEAAPFKLTKEMVQVMGGSSSAQPFKWFEELCVRAFLASRVYAEDICKIVAPMLESGLPCFKGNTIKRLRDRFVLNKSEVEAAHYMRTLISKSYESNFTKGYDEFQRLTNGIPY